MSIGGRGVVSVVGNIVPRDMKALVHGLRRGQDRRGASSWHRKLFPLCRDMLGVATNPIPIKTAMKLLGRDTGELRLPMCPLDKPAEDRVRQTLVSYGLLKSAPGPSPPPRSGGVGFSASWRNPHPNSANWRRWPLSPARSL